MFAKPQSEHQWLDQLVGEWRIAHECQMSDGSKSVAKGHMTCRSLGGLWLICESSGETVESGPWTNLMTVGFDPAQNQYVGTFIGSMMARIWPYHGVLDTTGRRLPLETEGPRFEGSGNCRYRDTIELIDPDHWMFSSEYQADSGEWVHFMTGEHVRV